MVEGRKRVMGEKKDRKRQKARQTGGDERRNRNAAIGRRKVRAVI